MLQESARLVLPLVWTALAQAATSAPPARVSPPDSQTALVNATMDTCSTQCLERATRSWFATTPAFSALPPTTLELVSRAKPTLLSPGSTPASVLKATTKMPPLATVWPATPPAEDAADRTTTTASAARPTPT